MREVETAPFSKGTSTEGVYFMMNNVKPIRVYVVSSHCWQTRIKKESNYVQFQGYNIYHLPQEG